MKPIRTFAIVLRRTNYGEADRILQVITPEYGKRSIMAKGVRREKSKLAGGIELFSVVELTLHPGKGDIDTLTSSRLHTFFTHILEDYDTLQLGYYVLKDISKASEQLHEPEFYEVLKVALTSMNDPHIDVRLVEIWYRLQMAILLGVAVNFATDVNGSKLDSEKIYAFSVEEMAFVETPQGSYTSDHIKFLRLLSSHSPIVAANVKDSSRLINECLIVARSAHE